MNAPGTPSRSTAGDPSRWRLLRPPVERPQGGRGPRALLAYVSVIAAVFAFGFGGLRPDPAWTEVAMKAGAGGMIVAGALLWFARRSPTVALGLTLLAVSLPGALYAYAERDDGDEKWGGAAVSFSHQGRTAPLTPAEIEGVPIGATRAEVIRMLGQPIGRGIQRVFEGPDLGCIAYAATGFDRDRGGDMHAFCFSGGRLAAKRDW